MGWQWEDSGKIELANADAIKSAILDRKPICSHCFKMYTPQERPFAEWFRTRSILMIPDSEPNPMLCDDCFGHVVHTYNPQVTNIGTSNSGPSNVLLAHI